MPGSRGSEEAAKNGTLNTAIRQLNLSLILYAVPCWLPNPLELRLAGSELASSNLIGPSDSPPPIQQRASTRRVPARDPRRAHHARQREVEVEVGGGRRAAGAALLEVGQRAVEPRLVREVPPRAQARLAGGGGL